MRLMSFRISLLRSLAWSAAGLTAILAVSWWFTASRHTPANDAIQQAEMAADQKSPSDTPSGQRVTLPPEKLGAAHLHSIEVHRQSLHPARTVPGRIDYRNILRVDIKAPIDSVIEEVLVKPGDAVERGSRLALLSSPEIGQARADVERNQADVAIARQNRDWAAAVEENLDALLEFLNKAPQPQQAADQFQKKVLGDHRPQVLAAYSRFHLARALFADIQPLAENGSVSAQAVKQRESNRDVAQAEFQGVTEQSRFDASQQRRKADAGFEYAVRLLEVSQQKLQTMLGEHSETREVRESHASSAQQHTRYYLTAPFAGTIEQRHVAAKQRVAGGTLLYVVADTRELEVSAEIRERDWKSLALPEGAVITVRLPALGGSEFTARVDYVGRYVAPESQSVPLVAVLPNPDNRFRPGMFCWVSLPLEVAGDALVVPPSALLTHEGRKFVFVEEGPDTFRRVDVTTGDESEAGVAITQGLHDAQKVVDRGAFLLKSELLLERETD